MENIKIDCNDIYLEETDKSLKTLKRFREAWLNHSPGMNAELFDYADPEFYFYRFAIDRQERSTEPLITSIIYRVMARYKITFEVPDDPKNAPFAFIITDGADRIGFTFNDFYEDDDINGIIGEYDLRRAFIIRTWKLGRTEEWLSRENAYYNNEGILLEAITIEDFFEKWFGPEEWNDFLLCVEKYINEARDITGYKSIKVLSSMNLSSQKTYEEKLLGEWDYKNYKYQIIDEKNKDIEKYLYLSNYKFPSETMSQMFEKYVDNKCLKTMVGRNEYAESFITSEWLYHSLEEKKNFDYTSIISGYLKSIEQLLYKIIMVNVNNGCKIKISDAKKNP